MKSIRWMSVFSAWITCACLLTPFQPVQGAQQSGVPVTDTFDESVIQHIAVGGRLLVDLHAEIMLAHDADDSRALNWFNAGYLWGSFGDFGFASTPYPTVGPVDGVKAVTFHGDSVLTGYPVVAEEEVDNSTRGNLATPASLTAADAAFALELWVYNPTVEPGECLVSWEGAYLPYPDAAHAPAAQWNHLVVIRDGDRETLFVNGQEHAEGPFIRSLPVEDGAPDVPITLGHGPGATGFTGSLSVVRIHEEPLTVEQVAANFEGGIPLGTVFLSNIDPNQLDDPTWGRSDNPKYKQRFSPRFRLMWDPVMDVNGIMTDEKAVEMLEGYESVYEVYEQLAMGAPIVSANKEQRGDGLKYKINICINWGGGAFGGFNGARGAGYPIHGPGIVHAHELGHAYQTQQLGGLAGNFWETHTEWMTKQYESRFTKFNYNNAMIPNAMFFVSNGRNYYHAYHIFEQLGLDERFGSMFIAKLWNTNGWDAYPFLRAEELFPEMTLALKDQWVKMARRNITWDYPDAIRNPSGVDLRRARTLLEPIPYRPDVYRVPRQMAPQQFGYNICPLEPTERTVSVELDGYIHPERGTDWRACLVAVNGDHEARYGDIFSYGQRSTMTLQDDEQELYLVVAATPTTMPIEMAGEGRSADFRSFEQHQFPYTVRLDGCEPKNIWIPEAPQVPGRPHVNGGGFVADTAMVESTAYVGPQAQVLDHAQVLDKALIEDYAVVSDHAIVRDHAVVSGFGRVTGAAVVKDYAKVRDFGSANSLVADYARVLEHAAANGRMTEYATAKGVAASNGNNSGTSIVDAMYAKANEVTQGMWLSWSWAVGQNAGERDEDLGGVYAQYLFEQPHPYLAWDTYGVAHGYLVGNPAVEDGMLTLNGTEQFVEMPRDVADFRNLTLSARVSWDGGAGQTLWSAGTDAAHSMRLVPADASGVLSFTIARNGRVQSIKADRPLPAGREVEVQVILSGEIGTLLIDGEEVGRNERMTLKPDSIRSRVAYLGRGMDGDFFKGRVASFTVYSVPLIDSMPPIPNPAQWRLEPAALSDTSVIMYAQPGCDPNPGIEYLFSETTGKGNSSGWQTSTMYEDKGLVAGETYTYTVRMRDAAGRETEASEPRSVVWQPKDYSVADRTPDGAPLFVIEAEEYQAVFPGRFHEWIPQNLLANHRGAGAMYSSPEDGFAIIDFMTDAPRMDYRFKVEEPGEYYLWTRGYGRWWMSNSIYVAIDGKDVQRAWPGWQNLTYRWKRHISQDHDQPLKAFVIDTPGYHTLNVWMGDDGCSADAFILTKAPYDRYQPTDELNIDRDLVGKGPAPSRLMRDGQAIIPGHALPEPPEWSALTPVMLNGHRAVMQARDYSDQFGDVTYEYEIVGAGEAGRVALDHPLHEVDGLLADRAHTFRFRIRTADGRESAWSEPRTAQWHEDRIYTEPEDGLTVIEAERYSASFAAPSGHQWVPTTEPPAGSAGSIVGFSGEGYMRTNIKNAMPFLGKTLDHKARLDYQIDFTQTGPHWVWVRGYGEHRFNHTLYVGLDITDTEWGRMLMGWEGLTWVRSKPFEIEAPGARTLSMWLNHDALVADKIIVTTDETFRPSEEADSSDGSPTGLGPDALAFER